MLTLFNRLKNRRLIVFMSVAAVCGAATAAVMVTKPAPGTPVIEAHDTLEGMPVSVRRTEPASCPAMVTAMGEVMPLWQSTIKARVEGPVAYLSPRLQAGNRVAAGEVLVRIDGSHFEMQVSEARSRLAEANIAYLKEVHETREAKMNWKRSGIGGEPVSVLALREPQLEAARAQVEASQAALAFAEIRLGYTEIRAPYEGVILHRMINPGETLFVGEDVFTIFDLQAVEVGIHLDADQWELLDEINEETQVRLISLQHEVVWRAQVVRDSRHLDRASRLRTIFLRVDKPLAQTPPLLPGAFVRAEITGRKIPDLVCIPETALTPKSHVWLVDDDNRLQSQTAQPVFYGEGVVYIRHPEPSRQSLRVAVAPNTSYTNGLLVQVMEDREE